MAVWRNTVITGEEPAFFAYFSIGNTEFKINFYEALFPFAWKTGLQLRDEFLQIKNNAAYILGLVDITKGIQ
jgi:hypothetical protein